MATADMITLEDVEEYVSDVRDYGILTFDTFFEKSRQDIFRKLRIEWWPRKSLGYRDISQLNEGLEMDETLLTESQFTRSCVYHCLGMYILPQMSRHDPEGDRFSEMMKFYRSQFAEEFAAVLLDGVEYDQNNDGTVQDAEKITVHYQRLVR
jgi:hypothetical protein